MCNILSKGIFYYGKRREREGMVAEVCTHILNTQKLTFFLSFLGHGFLCVTLKFSVDISKKKSWSMDFATSLESRKFCN